VNLDPNSISSSGFEGWSHQDILELIKLGLFDSEYYSSQHSDVVQAGIDPLMHFLEFGWKEARRPSANVTQSEMDFLMNLEGVIANPMQIFRMYHKLDDFQDD
jgi:hypothetical protein